MRLHAWRTLITPQFQCGIDRRRQKIGWIEQMSSRSPRPGLHLLLHERLFDCTQTGEKPFFPWNVKNETTILPDAIVSPESLNIALIHVDVVYALARGETEILVFLLLWSPLLTECEDGGIRVGNTEAHDVIDELAKVVVVS